MPTLKLVDVDDVVVFDGLELGLEPPPPQAASKQADNTSKTVFVSGLFKVFMTTLV